MDQTDRFLIPGSGQPAWTTLRQRYPWPERRPEAAPIDWSMDYGGRELLLEAIRTRGLRVVVEIGVFLGGSLRQWLAASPHVVAVAVDPWDDLESHPGRESFVARHPIGRRHASQLFAPEGHYASFLASAWDLRERVVPIRGRGAEVLPALHSIGLKPDLIYLDADKRGSELPICAELFPSAIIGGDDWIWSDGASFPMRGPARATARAQRRVLKTVDNTWLIDDRPWSAFERRLWWRRLPWTLRHELDAMRQRRQGRDSSRMKVR